MKRITLISFFLAIAAHAQQQQRVAILGTEDDGDPPMGVLEQRHLTDKLREIAGNILPNEKFSLMTQQSIVDRLGSEEQAVKLCKEATCLADLGRKVNADYVAQARLGRFEENLTIRVELYMVGNGNLISSFTGDSKNAKGLLSLLEAKAPALFSSIMSISSSPASPVALSEGAKGKKKSTDNVKPKKNNRSEVQSTNEYRNFSGGRRIATSFTNSLPGLGSILIMDDWTGAITQWALLGGGMIVLALGDQECETEYNGSQCELSTLGYIGTAAIVSTWMYGMLLRPFTYNKPNPNNTAHRKHEGFNVTVMPSRHGNFTPAVIYNKAF